MSLRVWDAATKGDRRLVRSGNRLAISPDGNWIASDYDERLKVWDATTGEETLVLDGHRMAVECIAYSPNGHLIVSGGNDGTLKIWNSSTGEETKSLAGHPRGVECEAFSPDAKYIVSGDWGGGINRSASASATVGP